MKEVKEASAYQEKKLSSGRVVHIRPRTYDEWEAQEGVRLKAVEDVPALSKAGDIQGAELAFQRAALQTRGLRLSVWVKDFAKERNKLTMRDIAEIENAAVELESEEIAVKNSKTGGDGQ